MHRTSSRLVRYLNDKKAPDTTYQSVDHENEFEGLDTPTTNRPPYPNETELEVQGWPVAPLPLRRAPLVQRYGALLFLLLPLPFIGVFSSVRCVKTIAR
jgi:hypothetical protein